MSCVAPNTLLGEAGGNDRGIIKKRQRCEEMQPLAYSQIDATRAERARYALELAQFKLRNGRLDEAIDLIQESFTMAMRGFFLSVFDKPSSPIFDPERIILKLRCRGAISRKEYLRLLEVYERTSQPHGDVQEVIETVGRLLHGGPAS